VQELLDRARIQRAAAAVDVEQHRQRPAVEDGVHGRDEGEVRTKHRILGADVERAERDVDRGGPAGGRHRVGGADIVRDRAFELLDVGPDGRDGGAVDAVLEVLPLVPAEVRDRQRDRVAHQLLFPIGRAGAPATRMPSGTSRSTTEPAPTTAQAPMRTPWITTAPAPMKAPSPTWTVPQRIAPGHT